MTRLLLALLVACGTPTPTPPTTPPKAAPRPETIDVAPLLARLDQIGGSFVTFDDDPLLVEIRAAGDAAVEPLIAIVERDERDSRAEFDKEHEFEPTVKVPVYRIAYWLLGKLIATSYFESPYTPEMTMARDGHDGRKRVAAELRAEWRKWRGVPVAERWYRILADPASSASEAIDAAKKILEFVETLHYYDPSDVTKRTPLAGEPLRAHAPPSVTELVAAQIAKLPLADACELARLLGRWDPAAARLVAAREMARAIAASEATVAEGHCIRALTIVRVALGDTRPTLDEYAAWIGGVAPPADAWEAGVFEPMWQHPDHPTIAAAADRLFGDKSPWLPLIPTTKSTNAAPRLDVLGLPMYGVRAFQRHVLAALADRRVVGSVETRADRAWSYAVAGAGTTSTTAEPDDTAFPTSATHALVRVADYYAFTIAKQTGAPRFELYWPLAQRDQVLALTAAWVRGRRPQP